ncbi:TPA: hypothetical protein EYP12_02495 [Candidatus Bipolaricaulota bacterium]|nr:hypothetical protein [Candidatus Bipolaricaulota bacterium]
MKLIHIVGARPQFIKMAAVSRAVAEHNKQAAQDAHIEELIVHTGQHYDYELSKIFFEELEIPKPDYNLGVGSGSHVVNVGDVMFDSVLYNLKLAESRSPTWRGSSWRRTRG